MVSFIDTAGLSAHSATWLELLLAEASKGMLMLIVAAILNFALRRASAASRHLVWTLALASLLAMPLLSFGLPSWQVPLLPGSLAKARPDAVTNSYSPTDEVGASLPQDFQPFAAAEEQAGTDAQGAPASPASAPAFQWKTIERLDWASWALIVWVAGASLILGRLLIGTVMVWCMARRARRITDGKWAGLVELLAPQVGINRPVTLLKSSRVTMPVTCGLMRSAVLLPSDADDWSIARRQVVLLHELAHVKRRDCLTQALAQVACAIYWFNPLIWGAARRLRMERERACDDQVLDAGTKASDYADHLLDLARSFKSASCSSLAAVAIARRSQLEGRLLAILDPGLSRGGLNRIASTSVGLIVALVVLPLAAIRPSAQAEAKVSPRAESTSLIAFDEGGRKVSPESHIVSEAVRQATGQAPDHQPEQSAQAPRVETAEDDELSRDEEETRQEAEQATKPEQRDNNSTIDALTEALKDDDAEVRQHALFALAQARGPRATEALASAMKDASPDVRERAVWALGIRPGEGKVDLLIEALRDNSWRIREKAAWALGLKGDRRSVQPLVNALRDENNEVRQKAAWALGLRGNAEAVEPLIDALADKDAKVRAVAAWSLGLRGDKRAAKALSAALKDENEEVRHKARWALGVLMMKLGEAAGGDRLLDTDVDMDLHFDGNDGGAGAKAKSMSEQK
jgi:beta-lactamase regulating signal transducer with metallopeptidase domain